MKIAFYACLTLFLYAICTFEAIAQVTDLRLTGDIKTQAISGHNLDLGTNAENGLDNQSVQARLRLTGRLAPRVSFLTEAPPPPGGAVMNFGEGRGEDPVTGELLGMQDFLELREAWLQLDQIFGYQPLAVRLGRQRIFEPYGFWWNRNFDAARILYDTTLVKGFLGIGQNLISYRTSGDDFNLADKNILRILAERSWQWRYRHFIEARALYQNDHSGLEPTGSFIQTTNRDDSDAWLFWAGTRITGALPGGEQRQKIAGHAYRADLIGLVGQEDSLMMSNIVPTGFRTISGSRNSTLCAWAFDGGVDITLPGKYKPGLSLGYAFGNAPDKTALRGLFELRLLF